MSTALRVKSRRVSSGPSSSTTTARPRSASSLATTAPPAPVPTTTTSARISSSRAMVAPDVTRSSQRGRSSAASGAWPPCGQRSMRKISASSKCATLSGVSSRRSDMRRRYGPRSHHSRNASRRAASRREKRLPYRRSAPFSIAASMVLNQRCAAPCSVARNASSRATAGSPPAGKRAPAGIAASAIATSVRISAGERHAAFDAFRRAGFAIAISSAPAICMASSYFPKYRLNGSLFSYSRLRLSTISPRRRYRRDGSRRLARAST